MSPQNVYKIFHKLLSEYEKAELLDYKEIYYCGEKYKCQISSSNKERNFDDEKMHYIFHLGDHLIYRYEIEALLGRGAFGQILKCYDHKFKEYVAIKVIKNQKAFLEQCKIEIKILNYIKMNDPNNESNIIKFKDYFYFRNHILIVFELLSINLFEMLKNRNYKGIKIDKIRNIGLQILKSINFLHRHKIIHCDLKPENILFLNNSRNKIKLIDL